MRTPVVLVVGQGDTDAVVSRRCRWSSAFRLSSSTRRPFHPERLHGAVDVLLDGVIRTRGRVWLANWSEQCAWIESAGGGMRIGPAGKWLAAMGSTELAYVNPQRRVLSELMWTERFGDRHTSMTVLACGAQPVEVMDALKGALLTDDEMATSHKWNEYTDPFGEWHEDPCDGLPGSAHETSVHDAPSGDQR